MSAAECEGLIPKINSSSSIPELIEFIGYTFSRQDFDEVQSILINREDGFNLKIENLEKDYCELKKERDLLEKTQTILELEKLELKVKLKEKDKMIKQMNEDIEELKNQKLESEHSAEISKEKVKSLEELRSKANAAIEGYKKRFENFSARFGKVEQFLAMLFKVDESDLFNLANNIEQSFPVEKNAVNFLNSDRKKKSYRNNSQPRGGSAKFGKCDLEHLRDPNERSPKIGESMSSKSPTVHPASESNGSGIDGVRETGLLPFLHDANRVVIVALSCCVEGEAVVDHAEAMVLLFGLRFAREHGFIIGCVESDCLVMINSLNEISEHAANEPFLRETGSLISSLGCGPCKFIHREMNDAVHAMAHCSLLVHG